MRLRIPVFLTLALALSLTLSGLCHAAPQNGDELTEPYLHATVRVATDKAEGFGFIVGEHSGALYILTADHVVKGLAPGQRPQVYFHDDPRAAVTAEHLTTDKGLDAAVLRVESPQGFDWRPAAYCLPPFERGDPVWFVGRDRDWFVPLDREAGQLPKRTPDYKGRIEISIGSVKPGTSGAPLIGKRGLVGMVTNDAVVSAEARAIDYLRRFVLHYRYPWNLPLCGEESKQQAKKQREVQAAPKGEPVGSGESKRQSTEQSVGEAMALAGVWTDPEAGIEFFRIDGGCFEMGSLPDEVGREDDERPHRVCLHQGDGFWMARTEVTNAQFRKFKPAHSSGSHEGRKLNGDLQPVVNVSWREAVAYAAWLSKKTGKLLRLPTEAEWEYATRAGTTSARFWGDDTDQACRYANSHDSSGNGAFGTYQLNNPDCKDGFRASAPVGQFEPNAWGLMDTLGNVWEWTCTEWNADYSGEEQKCVDRRTSNGIRVVRGGAWDRVPAGVRSAVRGRIDSNSRYNTVGFRLVRAE